MCAPLSSFETAKTSKRQKSLRVIRDAERMTLCTKSLIKSELKHQRILDQILDQTLANTPENKLQLKHQRTWEQTGAKTQKNIGINWN